MGLFKTVFGTGSWDTLPSVFVQSLKEELGKDDFFLLDHFSKKYKIFDQKFFQNNESFESDPDFRIDMFSNFLGSMGNQIAQNGEFQDAEKIYLLSLKIKEKNNPSHGGLAILYAQAGRIKEAKSEAAKALKILKELEESSVPIPEKVAPPGSLDDMHEILSSIINLNNRDYTNDKKKFMSVVTAFKDTTQKDKIPTCWSGIRFTDGSQCQISVAHKVMIYKGKSMFGGKFYDADARDIRVCYLVCFL
jgi:tetratricopeptide (TPR) repeat protein